MARGYLSGLIVGTLVSGLGLGTVSVMTSDQGAMAPQAGALDVPAGSEFNPSRDDTAAALPASEDTTTASASAPEVAAPEPDTLASLETADTQPAAQPETGGAEDAMTAPKTDEGDGSVSIDSEAPVLPSPQSQAPAVPEGEEDLSISTDPAQPAMPNMTEDDAAFPKTEGTVETSTDTSTEMAAMSEPAEEPVEGATEEMATSEENSADPDATPDIAEDALEPSSEAIQEPAEAEPVQSEAQTAEGTSDDTSDETTSTIGDLAPEVKTNRLPSVGDEPEEATAQSASEGEGESADGGSVEDLRPPLEKFAAEFENPEGKPLMSIILIDDGASPVGLQALESFPYPLSFAVAANWDGAEDAMIKYRASGFDVLALTDLPDGAGAQDAEVAMQATFAALPEVVGVMEGTGSGLQSSRAAAEQLAPILLDSGHGVVLFPKGLNTAQKLLAREGVPSAAVFRDFDAKEQNATVIRRFLDQAAFKAGQENAGVVMVGRLRPDTVSALLLWGLQDRANRVALAPISAILRGEE
ncbi:MAG: divergent polysaccharide deacetylase family protein [Roseovarius sp.]|nr:divergent polysaccharide deacetylase family protein [Roseovarius sp.]